MSANRTARNEAWIASLVLHVGVLAGVVAVAGRPRGAGGGPVAVHTRDPGHAIGVVLLDARPVRVLPTPLPVPDLQLAPSPPPIKPPALQPAMVPVRPVEHRVPVPSPPAGGGSRPAVGGHPAAGVPSAAGSPAGSPAPAAVVVNAAPPVAARPPLPAGAATAFFGVPAVGSSVVFVLDRSASMGLDGRLDRARRELAASLHRLPPSARFQVIAYNKAADPVAVPGYGGLLPATPDAVEAVIAAVNRLPAEGGSEHLKALSAALALGPDVIYFLTDEDDLEPRDVRTVTRLNRRRAAIHALCLVPPAGGETPIRELARNNRGEFRVVR
ncbi:MAG TPA: hypothetical protein VGF55_16260 [Gemmataceae bacterium]|jgi:hypothetical protein